MPILQTNLICDRSIIEQIIISIVFLWNHTSTTINKAPFGFEDRWTIASNSLQWRHNERDGISNNRHFDCLPNRLLRHRSKKTSKLRVAGLCEENSPVTGEFPAQRAVTRKMFPFDDVIMQTQIFGKWQECWALFISQVLVGSTKEEDDWGPALPENRKGRYAKELNNADHNTAHVPKISSMQESETNIFKRKTAPAYQIEVIRFWELQFMEYSSFCAVFISTKLFCLWMWFCNCCNVVVNSLSRFNSLRFGNTYVHQLTRSQFSPVKFK